MKQKPSRIKELDTLLRDTQHQIDTAERAIVFTHKKRNDNDTDHEAIGFTLSVLWHEKHRLLNRQDQLIFERDNITS